MRFESEKEKREIIRKVRDGRPILRWERTDISFQANYRKLAFVIYGEEKHFIVPSRRPLKIVLYLDGHFARNEQDRLILKRAINTNAVEEWTVRAEELLFHILTGNVIVKSAPDEDYYYDNSDDVYDNLLRTFRSKR